MSAPAGAEPVPRTVAKPIWFGPSERPLAGWLHTPADGRARAGVLLCPPMGIEAICVYYSYRVLATRLAEQGFAVLRFDYDGTGDSAGDETDPDRVPAWQRSVRQAADLLAGTGVSRLALVGIRLGGLMAAYEAHRRGGVDALVLWDPCLTGKSFLRQERARYRLTFGPGPRETDWVYGLGVSYDPSTVAALSEMSIAEMGGSLGRRTLMLVNSEGRPAGELLDQVAGRITDWGEATGQGDLLDPPKQTPPTEAIGRVTDWLSDVFGDSDPVVTTIPPERPAALVQVPDGAVVTERFVDLGPARLFGILSEPRQRRPAPTIVFINEGNTPHTGQSRMWVEMGRRWAAEGFRVLRWDLSGNGDSDARPGQQPHVSRAIEAFQDVEEALRSISPDDPSDVVLVGLCSGAYQSVEAALALAPRGICLLNPVLTFSAPEHETRLRPAKPATKPWLMRLARRPVRRIAGRRSDRHVARWTNSLDDAGWVAALARRFAWAPDWTWRLVNRLCLDNLPLQALERVITSGVEVLIMCSTEDLAPIQVGATGRMRRLLAKDGFHLEVLTDLDHSILDGPARSQVMDYLSRYLAERYRRLSPDSQVA